MSRQFTLQALNQTIMGHQRIFRRAVWFSIVVGSLLVLINQSGTIANGDRSLELLLRIALTYLTPFAVSLISSKLLQRFWTQKTEKLSEEVMAFQTFPKANPNPVFRVNTERELIYANPSSSAFQEHFKLVVGEAVPDELFEVVQVAVQATEAGDSLPRISVGHKTYTLAAAHDRAAGLSSVYGSDVTAAEVSQRLSDRNPSVVLRLSDDGTLLYGNPASAPLLSYLKIEVGEKLPENLVAKLLQTAREESAEDLEIGMQTATLSLHAIWVPEFSLYNVYGTDVSAIKALTRFPARNPNPVLRIGRSTGELLFSNAAAKPICSAMGITADSPLTKDWLPKLEEASRTSEPVRVEESERIYELSVVAIDGFDFFNLYGSDITASVAMEQMHHRLEEAGKAKSRFLANMSHEIRTPMNAILGYAQLLQRESGLTDKQRGHVQTINRSGEHLLALINDVLDMARIESGQMKAALSEVDFPQMLVDVERMFRLRTINENLSFKVENCGVPQFVVTDASKVRQVIINLLANACKFTDEGGIQLRASAVDVRDGEVLIRVEVEDTGMGIAAEDTESIFGVFKRTEAGEHRAGTGLGLAVSRQFATLLGGSLSVKSQVGVGSVFTFEFTAKVMASRHKEDRPQVVGIKDAPQGRRVLIVDDNRSNLDVLGSMLKVVGFFVREASGGAAALEALSVECPDVMLLDLRMPEVDGFEVMKRMRDIKGCEHLPVIVVSASVLESEEDLALMGGAESFLRKPVVEHLLFEELERVIGVEFAYAGAVAANEATSSPTEPMLDGLSDDFKERLREAALNSDMLLLDTLMEELSGEQPELVPVVGSFLDRFDYQGLVERL